MQKTVNYHSQMWRKGLEGIPNINKQGSGGKKTYPDDELVLMRLERANSNRGGGSLWDGIMTEKDKSGEYAHFTFYFACSADACVSVDFSDMCILGSFCATVMEDSGSLMPPPISPIERPIENTIAILGSDVLRIRFIVLAAFNAVLYVGTGSRCLFSEALSLTPKTTPKN